ncbi:hypothetical protein AWENTII_010019 [Aspergillus wentii]|nr:hypothetical protein MW887_006760 [Aspergillus wentii]
MKGIALRGQRASKPQGLVCHFCQFSPSPAPRRTPFVRQYASVSGLNRGTHFEQLRPKRALRTSLAPLQFVPRRFESNSPQNPAPLDPESALRQLADASAELRNSVSVPSDETVVHLLQKCQEIAEVIMAREQDQGEGVSTTRGEGSAVSSLLDLEEKSATTTKKQSKSTGNPQPKLVNSLSQIVDDILKDEKVFISPDALACYTNIQTLLKRAELFPEIFHMYAHKPVPEENSSPVKYHKANPKDINSAVPSELANKALDVAIEQKNLPLVLAIIDNTFCAPAFHRAKIFKKAGVPLGGLAAAPAACYAVASWASSLQNTMDPSTATAIAFAATLAYVGGTSSVGILAITTANDQMDRVVWQPGIPLRHRWLREEERAAMDKVAVAWGFKDIYMRGEEEGEEWESLREFIGMRGMILDKTDLMHGME